jgi:hypothetical protein
MIGLLLLTGVASFSVASEPTEQKTPVVKSAGGDSKIIVRGGFLGIHILVFPDRGVKTGEYIVWYKYEFNDEPFIKDDDYIRRFSLFPVGDSTGSLFALRMNDMLGSSSGTVKVTVRIGLNQNPAVAPEQEEVHEASFNGAYVSPFKQIS